MVFMQTLFTPLILEQIPIDLFGLTKEGGVESGK